VKTGVVTQWYPPEPAFIPGELARELTARGHEVRVLTAYPNYPDGRVYPGYRQRWNEHTTAGELTVRRVPVYPSHDTSAVGRVVNFLSFAATSSLAAPRYLAGVNAVYVYHPPPTAFAAAAVAKLIRRTPILLHVQDMWPESVTTSAMTPAGQRDASSTARSPPRCAASTGAPRRSPSSRRQWGADRRAGRPPGQSPNGAQLDR
jgi:hypothetical protein